MFYRITLVLASALVIAFPTIAQTLSAPDTVSADALVTVTLEGGYDKADFVTIVVPDTPEGRYEHYVYARKPTVELFAPVEAGDYEIRLLDGGPGYPTLARRALRVMPASAGLSAPARVKIGAPIPIRWQGPDNPQDFITIVPAGTPEGDYGAYAYTKKGSPLELTAPTTAGDYELRYLTGRGNKTLAAAPVTVTDVEASLSFDSPAALGGDLTVRWSGPGNPRDYITIVAAGAAQGDHGGYAYVGEGDTVSLRVPEQPGDYEVRYLTADSRRVLAAAPLRVGEVEAGLQAPASVTARQPFEVRWTGPGNELDYVAVTHPGQPRDYLSYGYTRRGNPLILEAPATPGAYELHYLTGQSSRSLAAVPLAVTPSPLPGALRVVAAEGAAGTGAPGAVELILDASGSMLQRLNGQRRIEIARDTLTQLVTEVLPAGTPYALRVFGHRRPDACDTELLAPLAPLEPGAAARALGGVQARNLAKTPIAASLARVADDLAGVEGPALVILVTDGEETCGGDPAAAIQALRQAGFEVRVNIVGFAIDEFALREQFARWAELGGGAYFDAQSAKALAAALRQSLQVPFTVFDPAGRRVASGIVDGEALELPAGEYRLRSGAGTVTVQVAAGETVTVEL